MDEHIHRLPCLRDEAIAALPHAFTKVTIRREITVTAKKDVDQASVSLHCVSHLPEMSFVGMMLACGDGKYLD